MRRPKGVTDGQRHSGENPARDKGKMTTEKETLKTEEPHKVPHPRLLTFRDTSAEDFY